MTKVRAPLTFSLAITTIAGRVGWSRAAEITGRAERTVQHWSESDRQGTPTLDQAIALDREFIEQGGGCAPILESYARQLDIALANSLGCRIALANDIALASRETGEALAFCIQAIQPDATPAMIHRAIMEAEEAQPLFSRILAHLKSMLPGNGARQRSAGEA